MHTVLPWSFFMTSHSGYMLLSRFLDLVRKRTFSQRVDSHLEFLLYQLSLALLRQERSPEDETNCASAFLELEPLNRLLAEGEGSHAAPGEVDRQLLNGLTRIVSKIGGETQCSTLTRQGTRRPSA
jgi:hypothetical protein